MGRPCLEHLHELNKKDKLIFKNKKDNFLTKSLSFDHQNKKEGTTRGSSILNLINEHLHLYD